MLYRMNIKTGQFIRSALVLCCAAAGCGQQGQVATENPENKDPSAAAAAHATRVAPRELWDAIYVKDSKIGYQQTTVELPQRADPDLLRIRSEMLVTFVRFGEETQLKVELESLERADGQLVRFHCSRGVDAAAHITEGQVKDGKLHLKSVQAGRTTNHAIPWETSWGGMFAIDSWLLRQPMKPGDHRTTRILMPIAFAAADVDMQALDFEETELLNGRRRLLKIEITYTIENVEIDEYRWVDAQGELWKSHSPQTQQTIYRTSKAVALRSAAGAAVDIAELNNIRVDRRLANPHSTRRIVYRASVKSGDLRNVFSQGASQQVRLVDDQTAEVTVRAISPGEPAKLNVVENAVVPADLEPNGMIQSDDGEIRRIAAAVAREETDPWKISLALERYVKEHITEVNFSKAFDSAAEVARNRSGDCTEHAVLLAALCRARGVPARVAIGLVYLPARQGGIFAYHMWNEAWIFDRWIPLDATLARGGIGAAHVKLTTSSLDGAGPETAFLPVVQVVGRLKLRLIEVDERPFER